MTLDDGLSKAIALAAETMVSLPQSISQILDEVYEGLLEDARSRLAAGEDTRTVHTLCRIKMNTMITAVWQAFQQSAAEPIIVNVDYTSLQRAYNTRFANSLIKEL
jgi:hypothetical protein